MICLCLFFLCLVRLSSAALCSPTAFVQNHHQLLIVLSKNRSSVRGVGFLYERKSVNDSWGQIKNAFHVSFGGKGLGRASSLLTEFLNEEWSPSIPDKKEGDLRSPIGIFELKTAFGRQQKQTFIQSLKFPYLELTPQSYCIDDVHSSQYNQYVSSPSSINHKSPNQPWSSAEDLYQTDVYDLGVWVDYNPKHISKKGSCIFIHRWTFPFETTAGCTALSSSNLKQVVSWLKQNQSPLLVQMPLGMYRKLYLKLGFPKINSLEVQTKGQTKGQAKDQ